MDCKTATPVPERFAVCGLPTAVSFTTNKPFRAPAAVGANPIVTLQLAFAASFLGEMGQVLDGSTEKSPLALIEVMDSDAARYWLQ